MALAFGVESLLRKGTRRRYEHISTSLDELQTRTYLCNARLQALRHARIVSSCRRTVVSESEGYNLFSGIFGGRLVCNP